MLGIVVLLLLAIQCPHHLVDSFHDGAPDLEQACLHLNPSGHLGSTETTPCPYTVTLDSEYYEPGETYQVTVHALGSLKGFLMQARVVDPEYHGHLETDTFGSFSLTADGFTQHTCESYMDPEKSITHTENYTEASETSVFTWTAPDSYVGHIVFRTTFVEWRRTFWQDVWTAALKDATAPEVTRPPTPSPPPPETIEPVTEQPLPEVELDECGLTMGCWRYPAECTSSLDCDYLLTWVVRDDHVDFNISALNDDADTTWVAVGFSHDHKMEFSSVTDCIYNTRTYETFVQMSYNHEGHMNTPLPDNTGLVEESLEGSNAGGTIQCSFTRYITVDSDMVFDLNHPYYVFLGKGPGQNGGKDRHIRIPEISLEMIDVTDDDYVNILESQGVHALIKAHGSLMIFAWLTFASFGVLLPRYYKPALPHLNILSKAVWYRLHHTVMTLVLVLTITAFIIIFYHVGGYSSTTNQPAHPIIGITVTVLVILNPLLALMRCDPNHPQRWLFNWAHFIIGQSAHILAAANMFLAVYMDKAGLPEWSVWILVSFVCWHVLVEITLAIHMHWLKNSMKIGQFNVSVKNTNSTHPPQIGKDSTAASDLQTEALSGSEFKTTVLMIHFMVVLILGIMMVTVLCL